MSLINTRLNTTDKVYLFNYRNFDRLANLGLNTWDNKHGTEEMLAKIAEKLEKKYGDNQNVR